MRVLWLTNDLPPRAGGIQQFVINLLRRVHADDTVVVGPSGGADAGLADLGERHRTVRLPGAVQPTPAVLRRTVAVGRAHRADVVVLGAAWPLGHLAGPLRAALGVPVVALSHGLEAGMVEAGLGRLVSRATRDLAAVTTISRYTADRLAGALASDRVVELPPGVDIDRFRPEVDGAAMRRRFGVPAGALLVGCVSRLVPRKGQDVLLEVWPTIRQRHPEAWLALVGEGPMQARLARQAGSLGAGSQVVLPGAVGWDELPATYAALDVFAMPCRTRLGGLDVEGLGIVYLEAQATGVPVVAGRSGGAPETVAGDEVGSVVDGSRPAEVGEAVAGWLGSASRRRAAAVPAREHVVANYAWDTLAQRFEHLLDGVVSGAPG